MKPTPMTSTAVAAGSRRRHGAAASLTAITLAVAGCATGGVAADLAAAEVRAEVEFVGTATGLDDRAHDRADAMSRLGAGLVASQPGENLVVSPVSILLAFAMLREGASGETADELDAMFAFDPAEPGAAVAELRARLAPHDGDVSKVDRENPPAEPLLHVADALFAAPDAGLTPEFLESVARFHDAGVFEADFAGGKAKPLLDAWVDRETGGLIEEAPSDPAPETRLSVLNAVVLAAQWRSPFSPEVTSEEDFVLADGERVTVDMMVQLAALRFASGDGWQAVELPYTSDFAMLVALPAEGSGSLGAAQWDEVRDAFGPGSGEESQVALWLPRWEFDAKVDLGQELRPLGLERVFEWTGDLDGVFPDAFVSAAAHAATITVAEKGTVAAAVTQLDMEAGSAPLIDVELRFDRPFDFQIVATADQLPVFAGHVADPRG